MRLLLLNDDGSEVWRAEGRIEFGDSEARAPRSDGKTPHPDWRRVAFLIEPREETT